MVSAHFEQHSIKPQISDNNCITHSFNHDFFNNKNYNKWHGISRFFFNSLFYYSELGKLFFPLPSVD